MYVAMHCILVKSKLADGIRRVMGITGFLGSKLCSYHYVYTYMHSILPSNGHPITSSFVQASF